MTQEDSTAQLNDQVDPDKDVSSELQSLPLAKALLQQRANTSIAYKFLSTWLLSVVLLIAIALITNVDWAKPFLQRQISGMIHRQVRLGHLSWSFGLNGLAVETNRLVIKTDAGGDFLTSAHAEMGVAFVPLLKKQIIVRHLSFEKPEFWATRTAQHAWNFDDLMDVGPDVRFIQTKHGIVHIADAAGVTPQWQTLTLEDVNLQFVYPIKNKKTPVHISFKLKRPEYVTNCSFTSIGGGPNNWKGNKYQFDAQADQLSLDDFMPFVRAVVEIDQKFELKKTEPQAKTIDELKAEADKKTGKDNLLPSIAGRFQVKLKGEGVWDTGLTAKLDVLAKDFSVVAPSLGVVEAKEAASDATVYIDREKLSWKDLVFKVANVELHSQGEIKNWKRRQSDYNARVAGHIDNLHDLHGLMERRVSTRRGELNVDPASFGGAAEISINASRVRDKSDIVTDVDAQGLKLKPFINENAQHLAPMMSLLGLGDNAQLTGKLKLIPNERLEITAGTLPLAKGLVTTSGVITLKDSNSHLEFDARSLQLSELRKSATGSQYISKDLQKIFTLSNKNKYSIGGVLNARGTVDTSPKKVQTEGEGDVSGFSIKASDKSIQMSDVKGSFNWTGKRLRLTHLGGLIAGGAYTLEGNTGLGRPPISTGA